MALRIVALRVLPTEAELLDQAVLIGRYQSTSEALRHALHLLFDNLKLRPGVHGKMSLERMGHPTRKHNRKEE